MILPESMRAPSELGNRIIAKIRSRADLQPLVTDFERAHGPLSNLYGANHFLLKYFYTDNWERECPENYVPVTIEECQAITRELGGTMLVNQSYLIPYLREKWRTDFDLSDGELEALVSTRIVVIEKEVRS